MKAAPRRLRRAAALAGSLAANLRRLRQWRAIAAAQAKTLTAIILTGRLGDIVAAQAMLPDLASPGRAIIWLAKPAYTDILAHNPALAATLPVTSTTEALLLRRLLPGIDWRNLHIDKTHCADFNIRIRNRNQFGIDFENFYDFGTLSDIYGLLATGRKQAAPPTIHTDPQFDAAGYLAAQFAAPRNPLLVLHPVSEEPQKTWPQSHTTQLTDWLLAHTDYNILEPGLTPCLAAARRIATPAATLPVSHQAALLAQAQLFIGVDSAFAHLAGAFATPAILLNGPYRNFPRPLPRRLKPPDILLRAHDSLAEICPNDVINAVRVIDTGLGRRAWGLIYGK